MTQADRAAGVLLGQACGDALGVPYEFGPALDDAFEPRMAGGGPFGFAPGEYSDDTAMAVCIAEVARSGADLTSADALDQIAQRFLDWAAGAKDVGTQTRAVFAETRHGTGPVGTRMREASQALAMAQPGRVGNGALMRTAIVALSRVRDRDATAAAARSVAMLTHADPLGLDSCVLWTEAVRVAVTTGELDLLGGLDLVPESRRERWRQWIDEATGVDPRRFDRNGYTVWALQAAWAAITWTPVPSDDPASHFAAALANAVRTGDDTDTVAAIAGGLLGARWGWSAVPLDWSRRVHGYGGHRARGLVALSLRTLNRGRIDGDGWPDAPHLDSHAYRSAPPTLVPHPHDAGVLLGTVTSPPHGCDAVISLCRIGADDVAPPGVEPIDHVEVRLVDTEDPAENPHLAHVLADVAAQVQRFRADGKTVFLHCVAAQNRTPSAAIAYSRLLGVPAEQAAAELLAVLPDARGRGLLWTTAAAVEPT